MKQKTYIAIDLKSFYASVECVERGLDPLNTNLVVADVSRTEKTICLAVTPSLKSFGVSSRPRLFEVIQKVNEINKDRLKKNNYKSFKKTSIYYDELIKNKDFKLDYIAATPQMSHYMKVSNKIYSIYLRYFSKDDIHVYSIDEVFIDVTTYLILYKCDASTLITKIVKDIFKETGITATAGIGSNLFLAKLAMDIIAKHSKENKDGVRIGILNEYNFRRLLWNHKPITDIWRIGPGIAKRLESLNIYTLGDIALKSIENEDELYKLIGINAELLIDHAWGYEPCSIKEIKEYKPKSKSISIGQVLSRGYTYNESFTIIKEMADELTLQLNIKKLLTSQIVMSIIYDEKSDLTNYDGLLCKNYYGKTMPYPSHSTINIDHYTSSFKVIYDSVLFLFKSIVNKKFLVRRVMLCSPTIRQDEDDTLKCIDLDLFGEYKKKEEIKERENKERRLENAIINIKNKFGKNAILKGNNLLKEGTQKERNSQIGGHKA